MAWNLKGDAEHSDFTVKGPYDDLVRCTIIGKDVPAPDEGTEIIRIGTGNTYIEIAGGRATLVGAAPDEAVQAVIDGINYALNLVGSQTPRLPEAHRKN